jgi:predicted  nucleic acid-binding Zn-ribbon protein
MTIKQALKRKNKLVAEIKAQYAIVKEHNSIEEGNIRRFNVTEILGNIETLTAELVDLKTRIHQANSSVYGKIFEMSELKSQIKEMKQISTQEGKVTGRYNMAPEIKQVEINVAQMNDRIKTIETRIEAIQDELDVHNATTNI